MYNLIMSVQKLKVIKPIKGVDSYSKNPIIDSLIKQKLHSEMKVVKDNFNQFIRREEAKPKDTKNIRTIKKRTFSVQDLAVIDSDRIKQMDKEVLAFVNQRQYSSPFHEPSQIEHINQARTDSEDFFVKIKSSDRNIFASHEKDPNFYHSLESKVKEKLPEDLWLPSQAEVREIIISKAQRIEAIPAKTIQSQVFNLQITNRPSSEGFQALKSSRSIASSKPKAGQSISITYQPKKYHKSDYQSLEKWLQIAVDFINKQAKVQSANDKQQEIRQHLNQIYTVYMCAIKEVIRLTYIQSAEKGLILEKIWWSMIRLFQELISEQHKLNYEEFRYFSRENTQQRLLYEDRMKKLQQKLRETEEKLEVNIKEKTKIALTGITYRKVNESMNAEIVRLMNSTTELQKQNSFLMSNLLKIIGQFQQRKIICIQKTESHNLYFYLNSKDQVEVVAKVPKAQQLQNHFHREMVDASAKELQEKAKLKQHNVGGLDNELCSYWQRKKIYLDIDEIVKAHFHCSVQDKAIQADSWGPRGYADAWVQCPEEGEETFQRFLKKQLESERERWSEKQREYQSTQITLKDLYDQLKESIDILSNQNLHYKTIIDQKDHEIGFQNKKIKQLEDKGQLLTKKLQLFEKDIEGHLQEKRKLKVEIESISGRLAEEKKKYMFEKENNNLLATSIYQLKEKNEALVQRFQDLEDRIRSVAPCLEEVLGLPQATQTRALVALTQAVEKYLGEYVEKDAKLFLTR